jgi:hypothetical protein
MACNGSCNACQLPTCKCDLGDSIRIGMIQLGCTSGPCKPVHSMRPRARHYTYRALEPHLYVPQYSSLGVQLLSRCVRAQAASKLNVHATLIWYCISDPPCCAITRLVSARLKVYDGCSCARTSWNVVEQAAVADAIIVPRGQHAAQSSSSSSHFPHKPASGLQEPPPLTQHF